MGRRRRAALLTRLELAVMRVVWDSGPDPLTVRQVVDRLNARRKKPLAYNTVQTMLTILKEKGMVASKPGPGRAHLYRALRTREQVSTSMVGDLVERLFDGRAKALLLHVVERESLGREELRDLRRWIDQRLRDDPEGAR